MASPIKISIEDTFLGDSDQKILRIVIPKDSLQYVVLHRMGQITLGELFSVLAKMEEDDVGSLKESPSFLRAYAHSVMYAARQAENDERKLSTFNDHVVDATRYLSQQIYGRLKQNSVQESMQADWAYLKKRPFGEDPGT